jgi:nucleotide-binding universal stress UspA family protein
MHLKTILCPTDYSELSQAALAYAAALARDHGARLVILHAVETLGPENVTYGEAVSRPQPQAYRQRLWDDLHRVKPPSFEGPVEYILSEEDPVEAILRTAAARACDLIVMGSHGRGGLKRWLMGSIAEQVVRKAPCPVLVVKAPRAIEQSPEEKTTAMHPEYLSERKA